jgi:hypothetical protein
VGSKSVTNGIDCFVNSFSGIFEGFLDVIAQVALIIFLSKVEDWGEELLEKLSLRHNYLGKSLISNH